MVHLSDELQAFARVLWIMLPGTLVVEYVGGSPHWAGAIFRGLFFTCLIVAFREREH